MQSSRESLAREWIRKIMKSIYRYTMAITTSALLAGCITEPGPRPPSICPAGLTYSCTATVGETRQCTCASREELREILDPVNDY